MSEPSVRLTPIGGGLTPVGGGLTPVGGGTETPPAPPQPAGPAPLTPPGSRPVSPPPLSPPGANSTMPPASRPVFSPGQPLAPPSVPLSPQQGVTGPPMPPPGGAAAAVRPPAGYYQPESEGPNKVLLFGGGAVALAAIVALFILFLPKPPVPAPTSFSSFSSADGKWACQVPDGWKQKPTGSASGTDSNQLNGLIVQRGGAEIQISFSTVAGLMGAQLMFGNEIVPEAMGGSRANGVDKIFKPAVKKRYKGYEEKPVAGGMPSAMSGLVLGESLGSEIKADMVVAEFSARSNNWGLGGPVRGYRAVLAGSDLIASVSCVCSAKDWEKLKPGFKKVIGSIRETGASSGDDDEEEIGGGVASPGRSGDTPVGWE